MIVVTIIRVSGLYDRHTDAVDLVWEYHWQWVEVCIAIIVVSFTAFRSFFIQHSSRNQSPRKQPWQYRVKAAMAKLTTSDSESSNQQWPRIPEATMTGMRTFIGGHGAHNKDREMWVPRQNESTFSETPSQKEDSKVISSEAV